VYESFRRKYSFQIKTVNIYAIFFSILVPLVSDLFSSVNNRTIGKFKVKRQRIEPNIIT